MYLWHELFVWANCTWARKFLANEQNYTGFGSVKVELFGPLGGSLNCSHCLTFIKLTQRFTWRQSHHWRWKSGLLSGYLRKGSPPETGRPILLNYLTVIVHNANSFWVKLAFSSPQFHSQWFLTSLTVEQKKKKTQFELTSELLCNFPYPWRELL